MQATEFKQRNFIAPSRLRSHYTTLYYVHCAKSFDTSKTTSVPPPPFPHPIHFLLYSPSALPRSPATPCPRREKRHREEEAEAEGPYVFLTGEGGRRGERTKGCSVSSLRRRKPDFLGTFPVSVGVERETKKNQKKERFLSPFLSFVPSEVYYVRHGRRRGRKEGLIPLPLFFLFSGFFCVWVCGVLLGRLRPHPFFRLHITNEEEEEWLFQLFLFPAPKMWLLLKIRPSPSHSAGGGKPLFLPFFSPSPVDGRREGNGGREGGRAQTNFSTFDSPLPSSSSSSSSSAATSSSFFPSLPRLRKLSWGEGEEEGK